MTSQPTQVDDANLLPLFESCALPFEHWTHRMHVRVAYLYLQKYAFDEALDRIRVGIKRYNAHNHVPEGPLSGYNETTTVAFLRLIHATARASERVMPSEDSVDFCATHPHLLAKTILRLYYSPFQRTRPDAKTSFVAPDLAPLPDVSKLASHAFHRHPSLNIKDEA